MAFTYGYLYATLNQTKNVSFSDIFFGKIQVEGVLLAAAADRESG